MIKTEKNHTANTPNFGLHNKTGQYLPNKFWTFFKIHKDIAKKLV